MPSRRVFSPIFRIDPEKWAKFGPSYKEIGNKWRPRPLTGPRDSCGQVLCNVPMRRHTGALRRPPPRWAGTGCPQRTGQRYWVFSAGRIPSRSVKPATPDTTARSFRSGRQQRQPPACRDTPYRRSFRGSGSPTPTRRPEGGRHCLDRRALLGLAADPTPMMRPGSCRPPGPGEPLA